jgi:uncharacterized RDD family membrane protein YckC
MNISQLLFDTDKNKKYASTFRRSAAGIIDIWITLILRAVFAQIAGLLLLNQALYNFFEDFKNEFGTSVPKNTPEHIDFIVHHSLFFYMLIFYAVIIMIGAIYHSYLNSSAWNGTIGKRLTGIVINTKSELPITFGRAIFHYFLSVLPFFFIFYLIVYQVQNEVGLYKAIIASDFHIFFGIIFVLWSQINIFTKKKDTIYDMIANTVVISGKTAAKWPWSKQS